MGTQNPLRRLLSRSFETPASALPSAGFSVSNTFYWLVRLKHIPLCSSLRLARLSVRVDPLTVKFPNASSSEPRSSPARRALQFAQSSELMKAIYAEAAALQTLLEEAACSLAPPDAAAVAREALRYVSDEGVWARGSSARPACEIMAENMVLDDDAVVSAPFPFRSL